MKFKRYFTNIFLSLFFTGLISFLIFAIITSSRVFSEGQFSVQIGLSLFLIFLVSLTLALMLYRPIRLLASRMSKMAEKGTLLLPEKRIDSNEIYDLARSIDAISNQLNSRIHTILQQKNEQEAVFSSMSEGVVALDAQKNIININKAATQILGLARAPQQNQNVIEVIRVPEIIELINESLEQRQGGERDVEISQGGEIRYMQVRTRPLLQADPEVSGLVLVLSDISRLRELEGMRKTFVANVSHELRTPLTSIQGFAETLLNPAVENVQEMKKFIAVIQRQASRLSQIVEDLLALSRLEKDIEDQQIELKECRLQEVIQNAIEACHISAQSKSIQIVTDLQNDIRADIDKHLMEQAIVNLIDNAIRYSDNNKKVIIKSTQEQNTCTVQVIDEGYGIPDKHLSRIFERFYRVDKARSRDVGGTGLGLSIVKYIALAHRGQVDVKSHLGQGSTFIITFPLKKARPH